MPPTRQESGMIGHLTYQGQENLFARPQSFANATISTSHVAGEDKSRDGIE
jgi:hypothetical protein